MDHPDLANIACLLAAAGVVLLLAGRGRAMVVGGLALIGLGDDERFAGFQARSQNREALEAYAARRKEEMGDGEP